MSTNEPVPQGRLATLRSNEIERNPHNPRILFDLEPMATLKKSIEEVGILVPIFAYRKRQIDPKHPDVKYVILDGERRWLCAQQIEKERTSEVPIPANIIAEPSIIQNILMMFNIHGVREAWDITPTALKLEVVMRHFKGKTQKELAKLTGLTPARVRDCQILLTFDKKYLDMSLREKPRRITGDFFIQMYPVLDLVKDRYPAIYRKLGRNGVIDLFVEKYESGEIRAVTEFRDFANLIRAPDLGAPRNIISNKVENLLTSPTPPGSIRSTFKEEAKEYVKAERMRAMADRLARNLKDLDIDNLSKRSPLFSSLKELRDVLDSILDRGK